MHALIQAWFLSTLVAWPPRGAEDLLDVVPLPPSPALGRALRANDAVWFRHTASEGVDLLAQRAHLPNLLQLSYGRWRPDDSQAGAPFDAYSGSYRADGDHFRLDLVFACLLNPPGAATGAWLPEMFGRNPLHGLLELDLDADSQTGGLTGCFSDAAFLYGNSVGRLGGLPAGPEHAGRASRQLACPDDDPSSEPMLDRSGCELVLYLEDFGTALLQGLGEITVERPAQSPTAPGEFGPGARWSIRAPQVCVLASGYGPFVLTSTHQLPQARWVFDHDIERDLTVVSFVYPLTQSGWARANGADPAHPPPPDFGVDAASSIEEVLTILVRSAALHVNGDDPFWVLISGWEGDTAAAHLDPASWRATGVFKTITNTPAIDEGLFAITDAWPEVVAGDVDASGAFDAADRAAAAQFLAAHDGDPALDAGPAGDGRISIVDFPLGFLVYDLDYDGDLDQDDANFAGCPALRYFGCSQAVLDCNGNGVDDACELERAPLAGDLDGDGQVGPADWAAFWACMSGPGVPAPPGCTAADLDLDGDVDLVDYSLFQQALGSVAAVANDCNANGVLDECELAGQDCNRDGVLDACQPELDCNANGVPDGCEGSGDWDGDCVISGADLAQLPACMSAPGSPYPGGLGCIVFDVDHDLDVDLEDFAHLSSMLGDASANCEPAAVPCGGRSLVQLWLSSSLDGAAAFVEPNPHFAARTLLSPQWRSLIYAKGTKLQLHLDPASAPDHDFIGWEIGGELIKSKDLPLHLVEEHSFALALFAP